jgi:DNA adenine methylase
MATEALLAKPRPAAPRGPSLARAVHAPAKEKPSPFLKWVGGKGRILSQLTPLLPPGIARMRHVEPFVGGGALFFARAPERALLCDVNPSLVGTYAAIRDDVEAVIAELDLLSAAHSVEAYYDVRARYNGTRASTHAAARAAMFVYLNKTCFNGLHRVNRKGEFNVPAGRYKNPKIVDPAGLRAASRALGRADLRCTGFEALLELARPGDFVYFDPPYVPLSATSSFTSYAQDGFTHDDQVRLRDVYRALDRRGCKLMLSNSDAPVVHELYAKYRVDLVAAPRAINCDARGRGKVTEVVVRNY